MPTIAATVAAGAAVTTKCKPHIHCHAMLKNVLSESKTRIMHLHSWREHYTIKHLQLDYSFAIRTKYSINWY